MCLLRSILLRVHYVRASDTADFGVCGTRKISSGRILRRSRVVDTLVDDSTKIVRDLYQFVSKAEAERSVENFRILKAWLFIIFGLIFVLIITTVIFVGIMAIFFSNH